MSLEHDQRKDIQYMKENFQRLEKTVEDGFANINNQLIMMSDTYVRKSEHDLQDAQIKSKINGVGEKVKSLEDSRKWIVVSVLTTGGTMILGIISAIFVALFK